MLRRLFLAAFAASTFFQILATQTAIAAPVPESERIAVDLRRTTLVVRDIDKSLPLYRDALGMKVIYDEVIGGVTRLVLLRANDDFVGVLGLMQRLNLTEPVPAPTFHKAKQHSNYRERADATQLQGCPTGRIVRRWHTFE